MQKQKFFNLIVTFLLLQPWLASSVETKPKALELTGSDSLVTPVYAVKSGKVKLKYEFSGSKLSSSLFIRIIPVKPANAKEILVYRTGDSSQTIPIKFKKFYLIVSALQGNWKLVLQKQKD